MKPKSTIVNKKHHRFNIFSLQQRANGCGRDAAGATIDC